MEEYLKSNIRTQVSTIEENVKNILFVKDEEISSLQVECENYQIVLESKQEQLKDYMKKIVKLESREKVILRMIHEERSKNDFLNLKLNSNNIMEDKSEYEEVLEQEVEELLKLNSPVKKGLIRVKRILDIRMEDETESSTDTSLHKMSRNETKSLKLDQKAVVNLRKLSPSEYLIAEDFEFEDDGDKTANGDLESSYLNLSQGIIEDIFSRNQPLSVDELCKVLEDLVNIDFNDIETPNDIGEADELEATFTLENMELMLAVPGRRCQCFPSVGI